MTIIYNGDSGLVVRTKINSLLAQPAVSVSSSKLLDSGDMQTRQRVTTGNSDVTITMPVASNYAGETVWIEKADTGTGKVIVGSALAHLYAQKDWCCLQSNGLAWEVVDWKIAPLAEIFLASGSYVVPPLVQMLQVEAYGAGGGGACGAGVLRGGGGGGGGGSYNIATLPARAISSPVVVTIGAGGAPGNSFSGIRNGFAGGSTSFGSFTAAPGGYAGAAFFSGTIAAGGATALSGLGWGMPGGAGVTISTTSINAGAAVVSTDGGLAPSSTPVVLARPGGGGGGGGAGITSAGAVTGAGGNGGPGGNFRGAASPGGAGGASDTGDPGANAPSVSLSALNFVSGGGGGGGASSTSGVAGAGGDGAQPGGGGGGGAGSTAGAGIITSGGAGGDGALLVVAIF